MTFKRLIFVVVFLFSSSAAHAQINIPSIINVLADPSGACASPGTPLQYNTQLNHLSACQGAAPGPYSWALVSGGSGGGNVTAASAASAANQICVASGASKTCTYIDFPDVKNFPAAICPGGSPGSGWSFGSTAYANSGGAACRAGTNNLNGYVAITDTAATFAQFQVPIPADWDTGADPYILVGLISVTDTTNGHTIIPQIQISCPTAVNGTVTDDHAFATAHALTTITMGASAVANGFYTTSVQMNSTDLTGCPAGGFMIVQLGRSTDTATGIIGFEYANITWPRLLAVQAN